MKIGCEVSVDAPKDVVWDIITDIDGAASTVSGIEKIEVLERPGEGLLGLKWRETRTMFGKTAVETMTVTEVVDGSHYCTEAHNHGAIYRTRMFVADVGGKTQLGMSFAGEAQTFAAKVMSGIFGPLMKGSTEKALRKDLDDIKAAAEARS